MKYFRAFLLFTIFSQISNAVISQHTFSIVAIDPQTGQIASAGATCLDLETDGADAYPISGIIPGKGAMNAQAFFLEANLENGLSSINLDANAADVLQFTLDNDTGQGTMADRQYGVAVIDADGNITTDAFTGADNFDYANHIIGPNYAIQGNILIGPEVLEGMENGFINCNGSFTDKVMAAMQGANIIGADSRCLIEGVSSRSAFIRTAKPDDAGDNLWLDIRLSSRPYGTEPIDSLQVLYDEWKAVNDKPENDLGIGELLSYQDGPTNISSIEPFTFTINNTGTTDQNLYLVGYRLNGGDEVVEQGQELIQAGESIEYTFSDIDLTAIQTHEVEIFLILDTDEYCINNETTFTIKNYPQLDVSVDSLIRLDPFSCSEILTATITNQGVEDINHIDFEILVNGQPLFPEFDGSLPTNNSLATNESMELGFNIEQFLENGPNEVMFRILTANQLIDDIQENDLLESIFDYSMFNSLYFVEVVTDAWPSETTWEVTDETGNILISGGPYEFTDTYVEAFCVEANECYNFNIFDSYGDGICCAYGQGNYSVTNEEGAELISGGQFGNQETQQFCGLMVSTDDLSQYTVNLFPNPTNEKLYIQLEDINDFRYKVISPDGRIVNVELIDNYLDVSLLQDGIYFLQLTNKKNAVQLMKTFIIANN